MTAEAGECNGRCGDLKAEKEMGGSYVIVNGGSGDRREEDRDPAEKKKIDPANGHGIGAKDVESGELRTENGDLCENGESGQSGVAEAKATENGDGKSSGENGEGREEDGGSVAEIPGARQNEPASAAVETMPELELEIPVVEAEDGGGSESRIDVKESEPVRASVTFKHVDSVAEIEVLSTQQPADSVRKELVQATKVVIEGNHDNSRGTKSGSDIVFVDTNSRRESESLIEVEDSKEPELEDNGSGPKSGSDMKVGQEDEPDTVIVGMENRNESGLHVEVEDVKEGDLIIVSESVAPATEDTSNPSDPVDTGLVTVVEVEKGHKGEGMKVERENDDDTKVKFVSDTKVEVLEPKPDIADVEAEDGGGLESPIEVKESEPVTASETFAPVVRGTVSAELDSEAEIEVQSTQQPEDPLDNELVAAMKVEIEDVKEPEIEANHDNGSDMKGGQEDEPDTVVGTDNRNESASHIEVEDVKQQDLTIISESVAPAIDGAGNPSDHVDTEFGTVAKVEEEHKDEGMDVEMERKSNDDTEIKLVSDTKVEVLEPKPEIADVEAEDRGGLELPIEVKESEPVTALETFEPLIEGTVTAELDSVAEIKIGSAQQPEDPVGNELVPATEVEIEEKHVNSSGTKSGSDIVFVDTEGQMESGSSVKVEDVKEPDIEENHDNSSGTKSGSDMKVGQEDKPDTVVASTENQNESESHIEVENVKERELIIVSESVAPAIEDNGNPVDPVHTELVTVAEIEEEQKDEGMKVEMEGKNDDNTEIKLVSDMKVVLGPKPEIAIVDTLDQEESDSLVKVKEPTTTIVAKSVEPVVDETGNEEVETAAEVEVDPSRQLEHLPAADGKVEEEEEERKESGSVLEETEVEKINIHELESPTEVKRTVDAEETKKPEAVIEEDDNADAESAAKFKDESRQEPGVEDDEVEIEATHIPDLESPPKVKNNAEIKVESRQNPEDTDVDNDRVEEEERKEEGSVLEEAMPKGSNITELEFTGEVEFQVEEEEKRVPESMVLEANNLAKPNSDEALGYVADVELTEAVVKESTIPGLEIKATELCPPTVNGIIDHVRGMQPESENGSEFVERDFKASSTEDNPSIDMDDDEESSHEQTTAAEVTEALLDTHVVKRHLVYLIKVPRFTDEELEKKIQKAVMELTEKTQIRESTQEDIRTKLVKLAEIEQEYQDASAYEDAEQAVFDAKNKELEDARVLINRINNVTSIIDIDEKIQSMVHRQQHETIDLKEEKYFIREINQLKRLREEISLNKPSQEQIDEALGQRTEAYARLEKLRKELTPLREVLKSATSDRKQVWRKIHGEKDLIRSLREQYKVANAVRQEAYAHLKELRKQSAEKFKHFSMYKADHNAAVTYRASGDNEGLRSHCSRQVERIMELWNNDKDFRREYVKSNVYSTLRRLGTLDGRSLGPGEEAPVVSSHATRKPTGPPLPSSNVETSSPLVASRPKPGKSEALATKQVTRTNYVSKVKSSMQPTTEGVLPQKKDEKETRLEELAKKEELARKEEEQRKEKAAKEEELRKKKAAEEEQLRKEKAAAEVKEKLVLEQKAKFKEAEERKRRQAEKAQAKADRREQKEAELKQQKKAKKEMKKSYGQEAGNRDVEGLATPATDMNPSAASSPQETETSVASTSKRRRSKSVAAKQYDRVQPLPLPLRNRGKRKMTTWMWVILTTLLVLLLFFAGNYISLSNFSGF